MPEEDASRDFRFKSSPLATLLVRGVGLAIIWVSLDLVRPWLNPSWESIRRLILLLPFGGVVCAAGCILLLGACEIHIVGGELRFRHFIAWESVPLVSITKMRNLGIGIYLRIDHPGECHHIIFSPEDYKVRPHPLPIITFLQETCRMNSHRPGGSGSG